MLVDLILVLSIQLRILGHHISIELLDLINSHVSLQTKLNWGRDRGKIKGIMQIVTIENLKGS